MATVLGIRVDNINKEQATQKARDFLTSGGQHTIFTPNPEMLVAAHKDSTFKRILNNGSLNLCDGRGVQLFGGLKHRVQGVDFVSSLCSLAVELNKSIYLLGSGDESVLQNTRANLLLTYPHLRIVGWHHGPQLDQKGEGDSRVVIDDINRRKPDILLVAFGHKKQEYWIYKHLSSLTTVSIAMGVGGAFDFISKKIKRAPSMMRMIGIEWLWRLLMQPKRIGRICTAVIIFPFLCIQSKR